MSHVCNEDVGDSREEISDEEYWVSTTSKEDALSLPVEEGIICCEHMNYYTKLLTDLVNVDVNIEKEDKELILLNSLPDEEYETFVLTLINGCPHLD